MKEVFLLCRHRHLFVRGCHCKRPQFDVLVGQPWQKVLLLRLASWIYRPPLYSTRKGQVPLDSYTSRFPCHVRN